MSFIDDCSLPEKPSGTLLPSTYMNIPKRRCLAQRACFHLKTLYLFTRSDIKTVLAPQIIFILSIALSRKSLTTAENPTSSEAVRRLPLAIMWIWLHLIVCGISNQRLADSIIEDELNKPWRPLAAKRLTPEHAQKLLLAIIPLVACASVLLGGFKPTLMMMTLIWMYNDLDGSSINIWARNFINMGGIMCFSAGSLEVLSGGELLPRTWAWIGLTGAVIATTVQALDIPDMEGDRARGRQTIPLIYGENVTRGGLAVMVMLSSIACSVFWELDPVYWTAPLGVGILMAVLTVLRRDQKSDDVVAKLWCLWMSVLYALPLFAA
ncbi:hypothetical protein CCHL11_00230 [Colletotrichum chlorophyti]|uniref:UbiA prenyltransferase n=1 Tax=Colletotrichum chlorophyti TaxID=708187 RepID=A0A1Q8RUL5_9PEZI|nr:hypothetical protein CCHL11_00230 [Colletotrichum chlorophyti]